jgi:hypothetical protein
VKHSGPFTVDHPLAGTQEWQGAFFGDLARICAAAGLSTLQAQVLNLKLRGYSPHSIARVTAAANSDSVNASYQEALRKLRDSRALTEELAGRLAAALQGEDEEAVDLPDLARPKHLR